MPVTAVGGQYSLPVEASVMLGKDGWDRNGTTLSRLRRRCVPRDSVEVAQPSIGAGSTAYPDVIEKPLSP
ncbi:MAG: hypothetical protein M3381_07245 [Actinomycetota bacterium]|nr:hypothetical protein [Actinomycetota bacterium]